MAKRLVIIGNGFDLCAGLKSSFFSFFEEYEKPVVEKWISNNSMDDLKNVSFISLLLYNTFYRKDYGYYDLRHVYHKVFYNGEYQRTFGVTTSPINWMDVEGFLYSLLNSPNIKILINIFNSHFKSRGERDIKSVCEYDNLIDHVSLSLYAKSYFYIDDFYDFLFAELNQFEKRFVAYLNEQRENTPHYLDNTELIINRLVGSSSGTILNFNYTFVSNLRFNSINVHGSLDDDVIIGIDGKEEVREEIIPFTKTFRKLIRNDYTTVLSQPYAEIVIYGHSLGKQDYSYFQSIFDYLNIYSGKVKITFIYSDYFVEEKPNNTSLNKNKHKIIMAKSFFNLIREYGKTLNNEDNGKNLLHKLIIEGRLKMELDNFEMVVRSDDIKNVDEQ